MYLFVQQTNIDVSLFCGAVAAIPELQKKIPMLLIALSPTFEKVFSWNGNAQLSLNTGPVGPNGPATLRSEG